MTATPTTTKNVRQLRVPMTASERAIYLDMQQAVIAAMQKVADKHDLPYHIECTKQPGIYGDTPFRATLPKRADEEYPVDVRVELRYPVRLIDNPNFNPDLPVEYE